MLFLVAELTSVGTVRGIAIVQSRNPKGASMYIIDRSGIVHFIRSKTQVAEKAKEGREAGK